jgi:hypothetical protein
MNGNSRQNRESAVDTLASVEGAIAERELLGRADEARFGIAATVANATPPVDETFRTMLRARIVTEASRSLERKRHGETIRKSRWTPDRWQLAVGGAFAATLLLVLAFASTRFGWWAVEGVDESGGRSIAQLPTEDVEALADRLNDEAAPRTVVVFPGEYAPALAERVEYDVVPLALGDDPAAPTVNAALEAVLPRSGPVDVVMLSQDGGAAAQRVSASLEQHLYRIYRAPGATGEEVFGALQRREYVAGAEGSALRAVNVVFENGIELVAGGVVGDPALGKPLRLALEWRAEEPVDDPVTVFAHLVCEGDRLVAQRDAIPGNGAFPATEWGPSEVVRDQFAVPLPQELPTGVCELQVGIYDAARQRRHQPLGLDGAWHVVIQLFSVDSTGVTV